MVFYPVRLVAISKVTKGNRAEPCAREVFKLLLVKDQTRASKKNTNDEVQMSSTNAPLSAMLY